jgi:hypothetical protein
MLLFQQISLAPPHVPSDPRPLFFPAQPARDPQVTALSSDAAPPPSPPPPPPLPVHPYHPPTTKKWGCPSGEQ